jgi:hypothetical protein
MFNKPTTVGQTVTINGTSTCTTGTTNSTSATINGYSDLGISCGYTHNTPTININSTGNLGMSCITPSSLLTLTNTNSMNQQVKVAVFKVTRNKNNEIKSSEFITEMWVENKPGVSIDFVVARKLDGKYDAYEIVIKQIFTVTL